MPWFGVYLSLLNDCSFPAAGGGVGESSNSTQLPELDATFPLLSSAVLFSCYVSVSCIFLSSYPVCIVYNVRFTLECQRWTHTLSASVGMFSAQRLWLYLRVCVGLCLCVHTCSCQSVCMLGGGVD